jgi:hypothetical protein
MMVKQNKNSFAFWHQIISQTAGGGRRNLREVLRSGRRGHDVAEGLTQKIDDEAK